MQHLNDEKFKKIIKLLYTANAGVNLFTELNVDEIFEIRIMSVNPKYRGQGVAKHLLQKSEEMARDNGFKVIYQLHLVYSSRIKLFTFGQSKDTIEQS